MKNKFAYVILPIFVILLGSCKKDPTDRLSSPLNDGGSSTTSGVFIVYDDEIKTRGGLGFIPGGGNQSIDLLDQSDPRQGLAQIRYTWNGETVSSQHLFAGFQMVITTEFGDAGSATPRDLSGPGYTELFFSLRGTLSAQTSLRVEGPDDGVGGITAARLNISASDISPVWKQYSLMIPAAHFTAVRSFVTVTFQYDQPPNTSNPGDGGLIYIDNIRYEK